jgi:hypothetical protein
MAMSLLMHVFDELRGILQDEAGLFVWELEIRLASGEKILLSPEKTLILGSSPESISSKEDALTEVAE